MAIFPVEKEAKELEERISELEKKLKEKTKEKEWALAHFAQKEQDLELAQKKLDQARAREQANMELEAELVSAIEEIKKEIEDFKMFMKFEKFRKEFK